MKISLRPTKKNFFHGTHRVCSPEETKLRIEPLMEEVGVTEISDITGKDRVGIPCYSAYRPHARRGGVKHHPGKGMDPLQSCVSAMMEAIERWSGEYHGDRMECASYEALGVHRAVDPADLILPRALEREEEIHWSPGYDLLNDMEVLVPSNAVFHPYDTLGMAFPLFQSGPTGLAAGNVIEEAILHGLLEVVERDAVSGAEKNRTFGLRLDVGTKGPAADLMQKYNDAGIVIHLWLVEGKTGIPTVAAAADDVQEKNPALLVTGAGTHTNPEIAAIKALTEIAQSRVTNIMGTKIEVREEMLDKIGYDRLKRINRNWFSDAEEIGLESVPDISTPRIDTDISLVLDRIRPTAEQVCICDLSRTGIPVVRVVVPGYEISHLDKSRIKRK